MVKHIVMWKLREDIDKPAAAAEMKRQLEGLAGQIEGLISINVGENISGGEYDVCLVSRHTDCEALRVYADHPLHAKVKQYVHSVILSRSSCDFME